MHKRALHLVHHLALGHGHRGVRAKRAQMGERLVEVDHAVVVGAGLAPHGQQYFRMQDTDGYAFVVLDALGLAGLDHLELDVWVHIGDATWEYTDSVKIWGTDSVGQEVVVLSDTDMDDLTEESFGSTKGIAALVAERRG